MTKDRIEEIKQFLKSHNYIVVVRQVDRNSCEVIFPNKNTINYELKPQGIEVQKNMELPEFWGCTQDARRILIACDISRSMRKLNINNEIVEYTDLNGNIVDGIADILIDPDNEEDIKKEKTLGYLISRSVEDNFPEDYEDLAETQGIATSYRLAKSFF